MTRLVTLLLLPACVSISDDEYAWRTGASAGSGGCTTQTWYTDADGDGYGDPTAAVQSCAQPSGTVSNHDDCDDTDPDLALLQQWVIDSDGDGYGGDLTTTACGRPEGYTDVSGDCDDANAAVHPDAGEDCATTWDDDCDGATNEINANGCTMFYEDDDGDGYGNEWSQCSCDPIAPFTVTEPDDCDDDDASINPGADEVCFDGVDNNCDGTSNGCGLSGDIDLVDADGVVLGESSGDHLGYAMVAAGDVNGDGVDDLLVGANLADRNGDKSGQATVVYGPLDGQVALGSAGATLRGNSQGDQAGWSVGAAGDYDGDGYDDVIVGAVYDGASDQGGAWLAWGPVTTGSLASAGVQLLGAAGNDRAGCSGVGLSDLDGTGARGLALGAYLVSVGAGSANGAVYIFGADVDSSGTLAEHAIAVLTGSNGDRAGYSVDSGDFDGDGISDLVVGADRNDTGGINSGAVHVLMGPFTDDLELANADGSWYGEDAYQSVGMSLAVAGDLDGDGVDDIVAGGPGYGSYAGAGSAYVLFGPATGDNSFADSPAVFSGDTAGDGAGRSVAAAGDFNDDGDRDLIVGAYLAGDGGEAYVIYGPFEGAIDPGSAGVVRLMAQSSGDQAGLSVAGGGDSSGDGTPDVWVGAIVADGVQTNSGVVYMMNGGGL